MASTITQSEFKDALSRYPEVLKGLSKPPKEGHDTLEELDHFRYHTAPASFSKKTGRVMELADIQRLLEWKMRHGTFRPTLGKLVNSNSNEKVAEATKDAFTYYASNKGDIAGTIERLAKPLKGVGPAMGSLLLSIHDPENIIFFSDELYRWLVTAGKKAASPKYTVKEFEDLFSKVKSFQERIKCTAQELEQVAFVITKENEPVYVPKPKKVPSGLPRGRPSKPDSEKKPKRVPVPGRGRGRPPTKNANDPAAPKRVAAAAKPITPKKASAAKATKSAKETPTSAPAPEGKKKRGRPSKASPATAEEALTPASRKRKATETPASNKSRAGKKAKV